MVTLYILILEWYYAIFFYCIVVEINFIISKLGLTTMIDYLMIFIVFFYCICIVVEIIFISPILGLTTMFC